MRQLKRQRYDWNMKGGETVMVMGGVTFVKILFERYFYKVVL